MLSVWCNCLSHSFSLRLSQHHIYIYIVNYIQSSSHPEDFNFLFPLCIPSQCIVREDKEETEKTLRTDSLYVVMFLVNIHNK